MKTDATPTQPPTGANAHRWTRVLTRYTEPSHARSAFELAVTAGLFAVIWLLVWLSLGVSYWLCLLLAVPAALLLVRLFLIQHDCGHGSFFRNRVVNDWVGRVIGIFTLTPYDFWQRTHAIHHAGSGNLERRGLGDIDTLTVREYMDLPAHRRLLYRVYRNPLVLFVIGPAYQFLLQHRLPVGLMHRGWKPWVSTMATNAGIVVIVIAMMWLVGVKSFLLVHLPITLLAASTGVWLFYVQHQFEDTHWSMEDNWRRHEAALHGSSHYDLPGVLRWFTANIGIHHVHHLNSRIPYYRLRAVLRDHPELAETGRITLGQSLRCIPLSLWCEENRRLISFGEVRRRFRERTGA